MQNKPTVALVIATYNWPEALQLVLDSVLEQKVFPDELIIADDGSTDSTRKLIDRYREKLPIPVKHFWHADNGFQKTIILNQAIAGTDCEYIVQVDGDIVLHPCFIKDHLRVAEKGYYIRGSRVMISEDKSNFFLIRDRMDRLSPLSAGIRNRINALRAPALSPLLIKKSKRSDNVAGCNCAFWKADFVTVNGYNNEINGWGHEDIELAARFINIGLSQKKVKMLAVCYHLHHTTVNRNREPINYQIYEHTLRQGIRYCTKGYSNYQKQYS
ncbi:glycosyltransferase family 2 protein [Chitinophaga cymbidii]|uniref:Glycosyl transferase family 2 n=1 Tax=Chitinophaga cymbidii TaxID=1096750 RepID=A0A512RHI2_9BACT|nr:glycosyltransferase family 2 protein [Chitinophaga cymbidii]GEP95148.1 glycosyl transferase family 2 [Chitinophaga cymbidii]